MATILDYKAVEPRRSFNRATSFAIPHSPKRVRLASISLVIPPSRDRDDNREN